MTDTRTTATDEDPLAAAVRQTAKAKTPPPADPAPSDEGTDTPDPTGDPADDDSAPAETAQDEPSPLVKDDGSPFTRADLDAIQTALRAARKDAKDAKKALADLQAKGGDRPLDEVVADAEQTAAAKWKPLMVRAAARAAFAEAGLSLPKGRADEALARAVRLLDEDTLTITDGGLVEGLTEQVEAIRADFPDLFTTAVRRPRVDAGDKPAPGKAPQSAADRLAARLLGAA